MKKEKKKVICTFLQISCAAVYIIIKKKPCIQLFPKILNGIFYTVHKDCSVQIVVFTHHTDHEPRKEINKQAVIYKLSVLFLLD